MRYITLNEDNIVISTRTGPDVVEGEIQSECGDVGQRMLSEGVFEDVEREATLQEKVTLEDQIAILQADIDYLILKQEGLI